MKKVLISGLFLTLISVLPAISADDTFTGGLLNSFQQKVNNTAVPVVNKEKQIRDQQAAMQYASQQKAFDRQKQLEEQQRAQQELINKKKQQLQNQKDMLNQQKQDLKGLFSIQ